ncbi:MAG: hypothetical protein ACR2MB_14410 [Acidimicrobiales bacterium]
MTVQAALFVGEAASQLTDEVKARFPEIAWAQQSKLKKPSDPRLLVDRP